VPRLRAVGRNVI
jgi:CRP-like cAMP-binding protein